MSNRIARNQAKLHSRLRKLFNPGVAIEGFGRQATVWDPKKEGQEVTVHVIGSQYHLSCKALGFTWHGPKLSDGVKQFKMLQLIAG